MPLHPNFGTRDNSDELRITPIQQPSAFPRSPKRENFLWCAPLKGCWVQSCV